MTKNNLPNGWVECSLIDICEVYQPKTISKKELIKDGKFAVYGANGQIGRYNKYNHKDSEVLITCRGTCGAINRSEPFSWINGNAMVIRPIHDNLSKNYLEFFLRSMDFTPYISGSLQPQITRSSLQPLKIKFPPLDEQKRIVEKIEREFGLIDEGIKSLKKAQEQIKQYRHSVLNSAFNPRCHCEAQPKQSPSVIASVAKGESAPSVIAREQSDRSNLTESKRDCFAPLRGSRNDGVGYRHCEAQNPPKQSILPNGWTECRLGDVVKPRRERTEPNRDNANEIFVGMDCINPNCLKLHKTYKMKDTKSTAFAFKKNDVLYGRMRSYLNKVYKAEMSGNASAEFIVFPPNDKIDSDFLKYLLHRQEFVRFASMNASGDRPRVKFESDLAHYKFYLPPLSEQQKIVQEIEKRFSAINSVEIAVNESLSKAKQLKQSILKIAFEGRLVAQDSNDKPATLPHSVIASDPFSSLRDPRSGAKQSKKGVK